MKKFFNVAGPCLEGKHYMLNATERLHGELINLINSEQYYVIHAARQVGKTTLLIEMVKKLNREDKYHAVYSSLESLFTTPTPEQGIPALLSSLEMSLENMRLPFTEKFREGIDLTDHANAFKKALRNYCSLLDKPLVIFFDEADCLSETMLLSFLRQLKDGYVNRTFMPFPVSVALVGMRNLRDYKMHIRPESETLGTTSPFNIITKALTLRNFTKDEVAMLYKQHIDETGQIFEQEAMEVAFEQTQGQPWLVNAIAREIVEEQLKRDYSIVITSSMINEAIQAIIKRRDVHIDQLLDKLKDPRVRSIIEPMILGDENMKLDEISDNLSYVLDLGLVRKNQKQLEPANPIYGEVMLRVLSYQTQFVLEGEEYPYEMPRYYKDSKIDMNYLLSDFQEFWRENSEIWESRYQYKEAVPHLVLQAFLQRVINGGGRIIREMASGRRRLDLCVVYKDRKYPIELKIKRGNKTEQDGLQQTERYMDVFGCKEGWLIIFDRDPNKLWDEKIYTKTIAIENDKTITVIGA